jgi:hypothetical protein
MEILRRLKRRQSRLCFLIPGSPNDAFFSQIAMFRIALDALGGMYKEARLVAVFGDAAAPPEIPARWQPHFGRITTHFVAPELFLAKSYRAQSDARWQHLPDDCDIAVFTNADALLVRPIDELISIVESAPGIAGSIAHYPFPQRPGETPRQKWTALASTFLGRAIPFEYAYTLLTDADPADDRLCPFYINFGFVLVSRTVVESIGREYIDLAARVMPLLEKPYFAGQVALTLEVYRHSIKHHAVDIRYNFPNDPVAARLYPDSAADVRVVHFLRTDRFDRHRIFAERDQFNEFLALPLDGVERLFQEHVRRLTTGVYPFGP